MSTPVIFLRRALVAVAVLAQPAIAADEPAKAESKDRVFIETSYLIAPRASGDLTLEGSSFDDRQKYAGAGFRYALKDHQETRIDVFVYPAGRNEQEAAVEQGMVEFTSGIRQAQDAGYLSDLQLLEESRFALDAAPAMPEPAAVPARIKAGDMDAALLATLAGTKPVGRRLRMRNVMQPSGTPIRSNGYLFYKQLYFFKVRASAAQERIAEAEFNALTDDAARTLVQAIEVANIGGCSEVVVNVDPDAGAEAVAATLVKQVAERRGENCFKDKDDAEVDRKSKSAGVVMIEFEPGDWNAK